MTAAKFLSALALAALTACADTEPQYLLEPAPSKLRVNSVVRTVITFVSVVSSTVPITLPAHMGRLNVFSLTTS